MDRVVTAELEAGAPPVKIEVVARGGDREQDVSALGDVLAFSDLTESVGRVARAMTDALRRARPDEAEVTFGLDVAVEAGRLTSLVVKGGATATFQVRLLWKSSDPVAPEPQ
ncbi:CU044_2847 family protein [Cellulomonas composti]|uniref:Trypsin-co-occurring domain-containing protein n=1 Tax=Cellulomonas composti TaxID=266130 RepID=A0A511J7P6_9CELL|nr:CU044_2847 family protein [Cellulomonas composti]GEL94020.1 hypothetical protein CCO02nite_06780 [Cellulomonas composti]